VCRIAGIYNAKSESLQADILRMRDSMQRGGPDDAGVFIHNDLPLAFGHRRLALIDLSSAGHQPMQSADSQLQLIFNGEIYNFKEIREELSNLGYKFNTQTDTEVILYSYQEWGVNCFQRFNGMFALAIWDEHKQEVVLARDHAGIKPLYYSIKDNVLVFASEIRAFKALHNSWETEVLWKPLFLLFGHLPEPFTTLKDVQSLEKGGWLRISLPSLKTEQGSFYVDDFTSRIFDEAAALEVARDILPQAVKRHLISDAPIGLFLSGGIDSSLLTLLATPVLKEQLRTLSIQFEEDAYSEEAYQKIIIDITGANHNAFKVSQLDFEENLPDILTAMDQPSTDAINTYFISMYAKQCGLTAVLSGIGADELFGGYPSFNRFNQWRTISHIPKFISSTIGKSSQPTLAKLSYAGYHPMMSLYLMNRGLYNVATASSFTGISVKEIEEGLAKVRVPSNIDYNSPNANVAMESLYMNNQLLKDADYMAMWHGIEIRVPFLDKELVKAVNSIAPSVKFRRNIPKGLLIEAFSTLLPAEIWHRKKQGFTFPFPYWLKSSEYLKPGNKTEAAVFKDFCAGNLHWSRYWALKMAGIPKFN
jgi:asparagine synthase (glutamine-hydrolysing)